MSLTGKIRRDEQKQFVTKKNYVNTLTESDRVKVYQ